MNWIIYIRNLVFRQNGLWMHMEHNDPFLVREDRNSFKNLEENNRLPETKLFSLGSDTISLFNLITQVDNKVVDESLFR